MRSLPRLISWFLSVVGGALVYGRPPNVILILADDLGYADLGCYGGQVPTPELDRLARSGLRLTQYYAAANQCVPSRAGLLTGRYPARYSMAKVEIPSSDSLGLPADEVTLAEVFQKADYTTGMIGTWDLGFQPTQLPTQRGFETFFGVPFSNDSHPIHEEAAQIDAFDAAWANPMTSSGWWDLPLMRNAVIVDRPTDQRFLTRRYTDESIGFIRRNRDHPFFLYLAHSMPHVPLFVHPKNYDPDVRSAYGRVLGELDASTGQIIATLQELDLSENTIVIFASDHGPWREKAHHAGRTEPFRGGKSTTFEGGFRVPFLIWGPSQIPAGLVVDRRVSAFDLFPTLAAFAGIELPESLQLDGTDASSFLSGEASPLDEPRPYFYFNPSGELEGVRSGPWKLLTCGTDTHLYHVVDDPGEHLNVFAERPLDVVRLTLLMEDFQVDLAGIAPQPHE